MAACVVCKILKEYRNSVPVSEQKSGLSLYAVNKAESFLFPLVFSHLSIENFQIYKKVERKQLLVLFFFKSAQRRN